MRGTGPSLGPSKRLGYGMGSESGFISHPAGKAPTLKLCMERWRTATFWEALPLAGAINPKEKAANSVARKQNIFTQEMIFSRVWRVTIHLGTLESLGDHTGRTLLRNTFNLSTTDVGAW